MDREGLQARKMTSKDPDGLALAVASGVHGAYVLNALHNDEHEGLIFSVGNTLVGLAWCGPRGNLVLIGTDATDRWASAIADHIGASGWQWRIALGPQVVVDLLASTSVRTPLAHRHQIYYVGNSGDVPANLLRDDVRLPQRRDRERLARATLALNASDLNISPSRVDRRWLYDMIDGRIKDNSTRVIGPLGGLWSKLDFGSQGPAGVILEGVFTFPDQRGRGLGSELVATCIKGAEVPLSLHVGENNRPARSSYERAGMIEAGACRLLLLA
jgi:GNAT superfamily N-acetyltransferase